MILSLALTACDKEDDAVQGFVDDNEFTVEDDGFCHVYYRLANDTGKPLYFVILGLSGDVMDMQYCAAGHALVRHRSGRAFPSLENSFRCIEVYYDAHGTSEGIRMTFNDFGVPAETPAPGDPDQWREEKIDGTHVWRTYVFTEADYDLACRKGKRY